MNANTPNPQITLSDAQVTTQPEELTLIDMLLIIVQHKRIVLICMLIGLTAGLGLAFLSHKIYTISTIIEIGSTEQDGIGQSAIEPPDSVIAKLKNAALPEIEYIHGQKTGQPNFVFLVDISNPKNTKIITLASKASMEKEAEHSQLLNELAQKLAKDHKNKFLLIRSSLDAELASAERTLSSIKEQGNVLKLQKELLEKNRLLTLEHLADVESQTKRIQDNRELAGRSVESKDQVLTIMMLDLQVARERDRREELQKRLTIDFVSEAERLLREEAAHSRQLQAQESAIAQIKIRVDNLLETKVIRPPQRSQLPVGMGRSVKTVLGLFVGIIIGVLFAFTLDSFQRRNARKLPTISA